MQKVQAFLLRNTPKNPMFQVGSVNAVPKKVLNRTRAFKITLNLPKPKDANVQLSDVFPILNFSAKGLRIFEIFEHGQSNYVHYCCHGSHTWIIL